MIALAFATAAVADDQETSDAVQERDSPWMLVPMISSDPKVGTSAGAMGSYLKKLDAHSTASMFGVGVTYSTTDSLLGGLFARTYWDEDSKRLNAFIGGGKINNDYSDFLGSGWPVSTTDNIKLFFLRYLQEVKHGWFLGAQAVYTNYTIVGDNYLTDEILKALGLAGFDSGAVGLVAQYDSRDNQNSPSQGISFTAHNLAYRRALGGEDNFDTLNIAYKHYFPQSEGNVFAFRSEGRWTSDAPASGYSSVSLRGYVRGQYLAPHSVLVEGEQRWRIKNRLGFNLFAGLACLYGNNRSCGDNSNLFPSAGLGMSYVLNEKEKMTVTMDYAQGKSSNRGFYMRFGHAF